MIEKELCIEYYNQNGVDYHFHFKNYKPHFKITEKSFNATKCSGKDTEEYVEKELSNRDTISSYSALALLILKHCKKSVPQKDTYRICLSNKASNKINEEEKSVLEEIISLHNDFVTPRRT